MYLPSLASPVDDSLLPPAFADPHPVSNATDNTDAITADNILLFFILINPFQIWVILFNYYSFLY